MDYLESLSYDELLQLLYQALPFQAREDIADLAGKLRLDPTSFVHDVLAAHVLKEQEQPINVENLVYVPAISEQERASFNVLLGDIEIEL